MDSKKETNVEIKAALEAGRILLESGAEISRVEDTMHIILQSYGIGGEDVFVLSNGIMFTVELAGEKVYAKVKHIPITGVSLNKIDEVNTLSRAISEGKIDAAEAIRRLQQIDAGINPKRNWEIPAALLGSGAFCYLFGGNLRDAMAAAISGMVMFFLLGILRTKETQRSKIILNLLGGFLAALLDFVWIRLGLGSQTALIITGSVMPLIPGVAVILAVRDIANSDYIAGIVRFLDAVLITVGIALGVECAYVFGSWIGLIGR